MDLPVLDITYKCVSVSCLVVSDSLQPHGLWPTSILCPWNSPGKNTGVGNHSPGDRTWVSCITGKFFIISATKETPKSKTVSHIRLCDPMNCSLPGSSCSWNSPGKNIGVGSHSFLHCIFLTHGLNLGLLHCREILYHLSHQGSTYI